MDQESRFLTSKENYVHTFMGWNIEFLGASTIGEFKTFLQELSKKVSEVPDDTELDSIWFHQNGIEITLKEGVP